MAFKAVEGTARMNLDFVLLSRVVILASGESRKRVPLELIDDRVPELAEEFTVELVEPVTGGAVLGEEISTVLTIEPSDDPNGVFSKMRLLRRVGSLVRASSRRSRSERRCWACVNVKIKHFKNGRWLSSPEAQEDIIR